MFKYRNLDLGLLLVRLALAIVFIAHGLQKFGNMEGTARFFDGLGFPAPVAYFVAAVELLSGLAMLLGAYTTIAGGLLAGVMLVAIYTVKFNAGFFGGYELDLLLLLAALGVAFAGPGRYALRREAAAPAQLM